MILETQGVLGLAAGVMAASDHRDSPNLRR